jgi:hypothetical protein
MVMNKQGEGFSWLASGNMPFTRAQIFYRRPVQRPLLAGIHWKIGPEWRLPLHGGHRRFGTGPEDPRR